MVIVKIVLVGAVIAAALIVAQQQHVFRKLGLVGTCQVVSSPNGDGSQWWSCQEGVLTGYPSLTRDSCTIQRITPERQIWRCPTPLETAPSY